jgi:hypothetical protein
MMKPPRTPWRRLAVAAALLALAAVPFAATASGPKHKWPLQRVIVPKGRPVAHRLLAEGTNDNAAWRVTIDVDHPDKTYQVGEVVNVTVTSEQDGYLYLFYSEADGSSVCLFPNQFQSSNRIRANQPVRVPDGSFKITVAAPVGPEVLKAVVTSQPLRELKLSELTGAAKGRRLPPTKALPPRRIKRLLAEAMTGDPNAGNGNGSMRQDKERYKQESPAQYEQKSKLWAEATIELTSIEGKGKQEQDGKQEQGKEQPKQEQGKEQPKQEQGKEQPKQEQGKEQPKQEQPKQEKQGTDQTEKAEPKALLKKKVNRK